MLVDGSGERKKDGISNVVGERGVGREREACDDVCFVLTVEKRDGGQHTV